MTANLATSTHRNTHTTALNAHSRGERKDPPAQNPQVWADHILVADNNDDNALDRLVKEYQSYALSLAARLHRGHEPREDLNQIALEGLVLALKRFEPARGIPFPAFATPTIMGAIRRYYRDHGWLVRVPRSVHEFVGKQRDTTERLSSSLHRPPTDAETATAMAVSMKELRLANMALHARDTCSLDAVVGEEDPLSERVGNEDAGYALAENRMAAETAIRELNDAGRRLLHLYFFEEYTQAQIAEVLKVSQTQVSRLLRDTLRQLRSQVEARVAS